VQLYADMPKWDAPEDQERVRMSALAERMLLGDWYQDLAQELTQYLAEPVVKRMTHPDITRNPLKSTSIQQNVLYTKPPTVTADGADDLTPILSPELWPLRQRCHLMTIGLRDSFMRLDWYEGRGLSYRVVAPSYVSAWATTERPDVPVVVQELRPRRKGSGDPVWTRDTWDVRDPAAPIFKIEAVVDGAWVDVTQTYYAGTGYPYLLGSAPILPWVMYHPEITDQLWHWNERLELIDGTLKVGCLWTLWIHGVRDCSHPQRVGVDVEAPQATSTGGPSPVDRIALDQSAILLFRSANGRNGSLSTLAPAMDPKDMADAILAYEAGLAQVAGINAADIQAGGTTGMSGYAIVVSREGQRRAWAAQKPAAMLGDQRLLATAAMLSNAYGGTSLPTDLAAYRIEYADISRTTDDILAEIEEVTKLVAAGYIGPIDAVRRLNPSLDFAGAVARLADIEKQKIIAAGITGQSVEPAPTDPPPAGA
jgi:hypothetical protein